MNGTPRHQKAFGLTSSLLILSIALSACLAPAEAVHLPPPPASVTAEYDAAWGNRSAARITVSGLESAEAIMGNGSRVDLPTLSVRIEPDPGLRIPSFWKGVEFTHALAHWNASHLGSASVVCQRPSDAPSDSSCSYNNPDRHVRAVPDAWGLPGYLGLGPWLGTVLVPGSTVPVTAWDPTGANTVEWTVAESPPLEGELCVTLTAAKPPSPKATVLFAPRFGTIRACEGFALPVELQHGPLSLTMRSYNASGVHWPAARPGVSLPAPRLPCDGTSPAHSTRVLPVEDWLAWGRHVDPVVAEWFDEHPATVVPPAYGFGQDLPRTGARASWNIVANLPLLDEASGEIIVRSVSERWEWRILLGTDSEYEESEALEGDKSVVFRVDGGNPCTGGTVELNASVTAAVGVSGFPVGYIKAMMIPEVWRAPWVGARGTIQPFEMQAGHEELAPSAWPSRTSVWMTPVVACGPNTGSGIAISEHVSLDPGSGWIRWLDVSSC